MTVLIIGIFLGWTFRWIRDIFYSKKIEKQINELPQNIREHCCNAIVFIAENPDKHHLSAYQLYDLFMQQEEDVETN